MTREVENYVVQGTEGRIHQCVGVLIFFGLIDGCNLLQHNFSLTR